MFESWKKWENWKDAEDYIENNSDGFTWEFSRTRIETMSTLISKDTKSILDLGAGKEWLKDYLNDSTIRYYPVDYCKRSNNTIICDFNQQEFPEVKADAIFVSGCLEWIKDYKWFINRICSSKPKEVILSYTVVINNDYTGRLKCWENALSESELCELFAINHYTLTNKKYIDNDISQPLMKFEAI